MIILIECGQCTLIYMESIETNTDTPVDFGSTCPRCTHETRLQYQVKEV